MKPSVTFHCSVCNKEVQSASYVCSKCRNRSRDKIARDTTRSELYIEIEHLKNALRLAEEHAKHFESLYRKLADIKIGDKLDD